MKILFMGTPDFAVPSLNILQNSQHQIVGVVTATDKPVGRGLKLRPSAVKENALKYDLPVLQPRHFEDSDFIRALQNLNADLFVVVAFRILPPSVFTLPKMGTMNLHASLLPKYRGAAPINWVIINGETETGLTTFFIQEKVDTGDMLLQKSIPIGDDETAGDLHDRLADLGAQLVLETVNRIESGTVKPLKQFGKVSKAPKLTKELCEINWAKESQDIRNLIRGLSPHPGAFTTLRGKIFKIFRSGLSAVSHTHGKPGEILDIDSKKSTFTVAARTGSLEILEIQLEGKRRMTTGEFLRGYDLTAGERLG
ncbi:MAG: methionyl-tRNA formyltransferase [bacterium]